MVVGLANALAWPLLAVAFLIFFRKGIRNLFDSFSAKNWNVELPGGIRASALAAEQRMDQSPANEGLKITLPAPSNSVAFAEQKILQDLKLIAPPDKEQLLVRSLANVQVQASHEWVYNRIFGSQIKYLKLLNQSANTSIEQARQFWQPYANAFPQLYTNYSFENWLAFMTSNFLISRQGDTLAIADVGNDFLVYLAAAKLSEERPW